MQPIAVPVWTRFHSAFTASAFTILYGMLTPTIQTTWWTLLNLTQHYSTPLSGHKATFRCKEATRTAHNSQSQPPSRRQQEDTTGYRRIKRQVRDGERLLSRFGQNEVEHLYISTSTMYLSRLSTVWYCMGIDLKFLVRSCGCDDRSWCSILCLYSSLKSFSNLRPKQFLLAKDFRKRANIMNRRWIQTTLAILGLYREICVNVPGKLSRVHFDGDGPVSLAEARWTTIV